MKYNTVSGLRVVITSQSFRFPPVAPCSGVVDSVLLVSSAIYLILFA
jgi:hypothetical protein